jgi:diaminopimelate epimerase
MKFTKMHGLGNDFVIMAGEDLEGKDPGKAALMLCDRHMGIGADGLLLFYRDSSAPVTMRLYNSDGSEAEMCGNGLRCLAKYLFDRKMVEGISFDVKTGAGILTVTVHPSRGIAQEIEVNMGYPRLKRHEIPVEGPGENRCMDESLQVGDRIYRITAVNMGNPHCIIFPENYEALRLREEGRAIEEHPFFPRKTNVEFVKVHSPSLLEVKVWERGAGETLACGTGACASLVASHLTGRSGRSAEVRLPGGSLHIEWTDRGDIVMRGPAVEVFQGKLHKKVRASLKKG